MQLKPSTLTNIVAPFGVTGAISEKQFTQRFRTFSIHNVEGVCNVTVGGSITNLGRYVAGTVMAIPVGVTVNFEAGSQPGVINKFNANAFKVTAANCIIIGTL